MLMNAANLKIRSRALQAIRGFFHSNGFIEVETPVRVPAPALETHIDAPPSGKAWLRTSPELHMKRLLCAGAENIFQIGPCFRAGECGRRHNPEFTMLEWYRAHADYNEILTDTAALLKHVLLTVKGSAVFNYQGQSVNLAAPWPRITVIDAFRQWAGWDPVTGWDADRFNADMDAKVEPALPRDRPCVLTDYPAAAAALARLKPGNPLVAERWELYIGGLEIANAYSELCDPDLQRARFFTAAAERQALGKEVYPLDEPFLSELARGMPPCGGIALGVDRLVMLACDTADIAEARLFCQQPGALV